MKNYSKYQIIEIIKTLTVTGKEQFTTEELANYSGLSRSLTSNYLSQLLKENRVKKIPSRPIKWSLDEEKSLFDNPFKMFVGYNQSHKQAIDRCIEAINYPQNGLPIILFGQSGTGKSFLSKLTYEYAKMQNIIPVESEYIVLNCANYANNPELLSSVLFGYEKGAFTGADEVREGMIKRSKGGYLFLDEVHRLSEENQEKLFTYMDTGKFGKLGSNRDGESSSTRLIFATTESAESTFLTTFLRRIPVKIQLKGYQQRPTDERFELVDYLLKNEAIKIKKRIVMDSKVVTILCNSDFSGNIGELKNLIKLCCAEAYVAQENPDLLIDNNILNNKMKATSYLQEQYPSIYTDKNIVRDYCHQSIQEVSMEINRFIKKEISIIEIRQFLFERFYQQKINYFESDNVAFKEFYKCWKNLFLDSYGLKMELTEVQIGYYFYSLFKEHNYELKKIESLGGFGNRRAIYLSQRFLSDFLCFTGREQNYLIIIFSTLLHFYIAQDIETIGVLVAHGSSTASSIRNVVNNLCNTFVFEAFDMPLSTTSNEISTQVLNYLQTLGVTQPLVLMIDMGSLSQLYSHIAQSTHNDVLVVDNLSTTTALDMGVRISTRHKFNSIVKNVAQEYRINVKYYEGISYKENIIISCLSGLGISEKIAEIFRKHFDNSEIEVVVLDYLELKRSLKENEHMLDSSIAIFSTTELDSQNQKYTNRWVNIYEIFDESFAQKLYSTLESHLEKEKFQELIEELFRLFSLEGIGERLVFLKPEVIFGEVDKVIHQYEVQYQVIFIHKVKINLYMHIAFMIERLITEKQIPKALLGYEDNQAYQKFNVDSISIFSDIQSKFNVVVNQYEVQMLFELMKGYLF